MLYECTFCGKTHVKLWRPIYDSKPLLCAKCLEERQSPQEYAELIWEKGPNYVWGKRTGRKLPLPKWTIDEKGTIPCSLGPGPDGAPFYMTNQLIINLKTGQTQMIPAIPHGNDKFWAYNSAPTSFSIWWENLPTN